MIIWTLHAYWLFESRLAEEIRATDARFGIEEEGELAPVVPIRG